MYRIYIWNQLIFTTDNYNLACGRYMQHATKHGERSLSFEHVEE